MFFSGCTGWCSLFLPAFWNCPHKKYYSISCFSRNPKSDRVRVTKSSSGRSNCDGSKGGSPVMDGWVNKTEGLFLKAQSVCKHAGSSTWTVMAFVFIKWALWLCVRHMTFTDVFDPPGVWNTAAVQSSAITEPFLFPWVSFTYENSY